MAIEDSGPVAALRRELDEARRAAGDASAEGARLRERLTAVERERDEARAVIAAACAALGPSATGDLAADVARVVREREEHARDADAAEATLRETTIALERVRGDMRAAEERGVRAGLEAAAARLRGYAADRADYMDADMMARTRHARDLATEVDLLQSCVASIVARIEAPPVEAAAEPPHRGGDVWRHDHDKFADVVESVDVDNAGTWLRFESRPSAYASAMESGGWRRVRCAPAVGDAVRVGDAVGTVARLPEAPLQGVRVDGPGDRMTIAEAGELEMAARGAR